MKTLAIDLGGSRAKMALFCGKSMCAQTLFPVDSRALLCETLSLIQAQGRRLLGDVAPDIVALALPGIVHRGRPIAFNGKYEEAVTFDWAGWARDAFCTGILLINDAAAALYGEMYHGAAKDTGDAVILIMGTGIGTAAAADGRILEGRHGTMGMLGGHIAIEMLCERRCSCGSMGCLEAWAGTWAINELARESDSFAKSSLSRCPRVDYRALAQGAQQRDPLSAKLLDLAIRALGMGAVNLIHAYDPQVLVLSGGPCHIPALCDGIRDYVRRYAWTPWGQTDIRIAENPETSVL